MGALSVWRHSCQRDGAYRVALTRDLLDGSLFAGDVVVSISCDGEAYAVALLSTDSGPEGYGPHRIHRARRPLACLRDPNAKLYFMTIEAGQFNPPGSDSGHSAVRPASVCVLGPVSGGVGLPWIRLTGLTEYAAREDVTPNAPGFIRADRPSELNGVAVYQAFVVWPGPPEARSGLRTAT